MAGVGDMMAEGKRGARPVRYISLNGGSPQDVAGQVVEESLVCITVNGRELATFMASPFGLDHLALGFLHNEGLINSLDDVRSLHISKNDTCVDIWLNDLDFEMPERAIITAGCGGGITFDDLTARHEPLHSTLSASPAELGTLMRQMHLGANLYQQARGIHTAALADRHEILMQVEDVGRHNCVDKLRGRSLVEGVDTADRILLSSGRVSSEMINKARRLGTPIVCSRTSPTSLSVALARSWNMTIAAYVRQNRMRIYSYPERILETERL
jgi:FdhD protein